MKMQFFKRWQGAKGVVLVLALGVSGAWGQAVSGDLQKEIVKLGKERRLVLREERKFFHEKGLQEDEALLALEKKLMEKGRELGEARRVHPALKEDYVKSDQAKDQMIKAQIGGDKEAQRKARSEFTRVRVEMERKANELAELKPHYEALQELTKQVEVRKQELLGQTEEGRALIKKSAALQERIEALREKARGAK